MKLTQKMIDVENETTGGYNLNSVIYLVTILLIYIYIVLTDIH